MNRGQFAGAVQPGEHEGVAAVRLLAQALFRWGLGRRDHDAGDLELLQPAVEDEPRGAGLVDEMQGDAVAAEFADHFFQRAKVRGDLAVEAHLPVAAAIGHCDHRGIFVDIQAHILSRRLHVLVSVFGCWFHRHTHAARLLLREQSASPGTSTLYFPRCASHAAIMSGQKDYLQIASVADLARTIVILADPLILNEPTYPRSPYFARLRERS
jgi:hypothetical protein